MYSIGVLNRCRVHSFMGIFALAKELLNGEKKGFFFSTNMFYYNYICFDYIKCKMNATESTSYKHISKK